MRLPFGLGRRSSSGDGASGGSSGSASAPGSGAAPALPAAPPSSRAWAALPPIQRTAGSMPQVAAPARFTAALPGTRGLPPIVQPLGHEVSALAAPGLVVARTRAVEIAANGSIPTPVQRRAARGSKGASAVAPAAVATTEPDVVEHHHEAPVATAVPAPSAPIRTMPTVSRSAVRVPDRPLTSAASAARPAVVQRAAAAAAVTPGAPSVPLPPPASGMRRAPSTVQRSEAAPAAAAAPASSYRSGLGEPLTGLPASARPIAAPGPVISRSATAGPMPIAAPSLRTPVQRTANAGTPVGPLALPTGSPAPAAAFAPRLPELPILPVARKATAAAAPAPAPAPSLSTTPVAATPEIRPIAGANPIRTSAALQREAADDADDESDDGDALPTPWWSAGDAAPRQAMAAMGGVADAAPTMIQRSAIATGAPVGSPFAARGHADATGPAMAPGRAPVQRSAAPSARPSLPSLALPHAPGRGPAASTAPGNDVPAPSLSVPARSVVSDPVVQTTPARTFPAGSGGGLGAGAVVQREGNVAVAAPAPAEPAAPGAAIAPAGGGGGQPSRGSSHSERDLDELASALFGRIRSRLRTDLIHDREAKGLTFDNV